MLGSDSPLKKLNDLKPDCQGTTSLIGVTHSISSPFPTKGCDLLCRIQLIDDSTDQILTCLLFGYHSSLPKRDVIPELSILRLTSVKVQYFAGRPQINKSNAYSFSIFHPTEESFTALDQSPKCGGELSDEHKKRITELRAWLKSPAFSPNNFGWKTASNFKDPVSEQRAVSNEASIHHAKRVKIATEKSGNTLEQPDLEAIADFDLITNERPIDRFNKFNDFPVPLKDVTLNLYCNLNLQVIGVGKCLKSIVLRCLDGTIPQIDTLKISPLHIQSNLSQHALLQLDQYTVDVTIFDDHMDFAKSLLPGDFISLTNVHCYIPYGLSQPEVILHGGTSYNRGVKKLETEGLTEKWMQNRIDEIPIEPETSTTDLSLPEDEPRSVQTSPTECLYPEQSLTTLTKILNEPSNKGLYKIRVYLHSHLPETYPAMIKICCERCNTVNTSEQCAKCKESDFVKTLYFKFLVQDDSSEELVPVFCFGGQARDFVGVERIKTSFDLEPLNLVVGRWCDLHVLCKVQSDGKVKLMLAHTIVKRV